MDYGITLQMRVHPTPWKSYLVIMAVFHVLMESSHHGMRAQVQQPARPANRFISRDL